MKSLRLRLVGFILAAVAAVWIGTTLVLWHEIHRELRELLHHLPPDSMEVVAHEQEDLIGEFTDHVVMPMLVALPALAILMLGAVSFALRPLQRIAHEVEARAPDYLAPLETVGAPSEVRPLIDRLNRLFGDIGRAFDNERRLTSDAAHELRTPLAALKTQAQVALAATDAASRDHALRQIVAGCDRATHLVEQLLTLARLDDTRDAPFVAIDLAQLAAEVLGEAADEAVRHGQNLSLADEGAACRVRGDRTLLAVLLRNLLRNAIRHAPAGTSIEVAVAAVGGGCMLAVVDDGPGIADDEREAIVQRFRRGSNAQGSGSGLGLSIALRIAELHGATLTLAPRPAGRGLAARVAFPPLSA